MSWLSDWAKRIKITVDYTKIDSALTNFPTLVYLSTSSGQSNVDVSSVFDELNSDANRKKIAITTSDGVTQCYVEIERWDHTSEKAWLWVKIPSILYGEETVIYIYYDELKDDNTTYVGDTGDTAAQNVWDNNFMAVWHMGQDPSGGANCIKDSTSGAKHGTPSGTMTSEDLVDGKIGKAIDFDGATSYIDIGDVDMDFGVGGLTLESIIKAPDYASGRVIIQRQDNLNEYIPYIQLRLGTLGEIRFIVRGLTNPASLINFVSDGVNYDNNSWAYIVGIFDDPNDSGTILTNGTSDGAVSSKTTTDVNFGQAKLHLGKMYQGWVPVSTKYFLGILEEIRVSKIPRLPAWLKTTYYSSWDDLVNFGSEQTPVTEGISVDEYLFIPHSWKKPLEFSIEWRTNLLSMISKGEQRSSLVTWPRRGLKLDIRPASIENFNYLKRHLYKSLHKLWGIPYWQDKTELSSDASSGQPILQVLSTQHRNFEEGGLCVVLSSLTSYEVGAINSLDPSQITLNTNLTFSWGAGTEVYPILKGRLKAAVGLEIPVPQVGGLALEFDEAWDENIVKSLGDASAFPTYNDIPILNLKPDWSTPVKQSILHPYELLQFLGKDFMFSAREYSDIGVGEKLSLFGRENVWNFRGFFNEMRGIYGKFWLPSHQYDVVVVDAFDATDITLTIQDIDFPAYWSTEDVYLLFHFQDHTEICRKVEPAPDFTHITLDEAIGKSCSAEELDQLRVSFLYLSRFDMDRLILKYRVPEVIEAVITGMRVEA